MDQLHTGDLMIERQGQRDRDRDRDRGTGTSFDFESGGSAVKLKWD